MAQPSAQLNAPCCFHWKALNLTRRVAIPFVYNHSRTNWSQLKTILRCKFVLLLDVNRSAVFFPDGDFQPSCSDVPKCKVIRAICSLGRKELQFCVKLHSDNLPARLLAKQARHRSHEKIQKSPAKKATETWRSKYLYHLDGISNGKELTSSLVFASNDDFWQCYLPRTKAVQLNPGRLYFYHRDHARVPILLPLTQKCSALFN